MSLPQNLPNDKFNRTVTASLAGDGTSYTYTVFDSISSATFAVTFDPKVNVNDVYSSINGIGPSWYTPPVPPTVADSQLTIVNSLPYTCLSTDYLVAVTNPPGTITLPDSSTVGSALPGLPYLIFINDASGSAATNNITIAGQNGQTINGNASVQIKNNNATKIFYAHKGNWRSIV